MKNITVVNREMIADIISEFEGWLESKGVTKEMIPNKERNDIYDALIYSSDYDDLEIRIRSSLHDYGIIAPEVFGEIDSDVIQNAINEAL